MRRRVKLFEKKKILDDVISFAVMTKLTESDNFDAYLEILPGRWIPYRTKSFKTYETCDMNIPENLKKEVIPSTRPPRQPRQERFPLAYEYADAEVFPDEVLTSSFFTQLKTAPMVVVASSNWDGMKFRAPVKGSPAYNFMKAERVKEVAQNLSKEYEYVYFFTMTYSPKDHGTDRVYAWNFLREEVSNLQKALARKYKIKYISVFEATARGYPHCHTVIFSKHPLTGEQKPTRHVVKITFGKLFDFISRRVKSPVFDLRRAVNDKIPNYLIKYLSKSFSKQSLEKFLLGQPLTAEERKALGTLIWPCIAGVRSLSCSKPTQGEIPVEIEEQNETPIPDLQEPEESPEGDWVDELVQRQWDAFSDDRKVEMTAQRAVSLMVFRIKSHKICKRRVFLMSPRRLTPTDEATAGHFSGNRYKLFGDRQCFVKKMGCPGCMYEDAFELFHSDREKFYEMLPTDPFVVPPAESKDSVSAYIEDTGKIDFDWTAITTFTGKTRCVIGYSPKMQRKDRWEAAEAKVQLLRNFKNLDEGQLWRGI